MTPTKHTMSVLAQIISWIPDRIIENLARKHRIQTRSFSATSHVISMVYAHLAHALSLNDICNSLSNHAGTLKAAPQLHSSKPQWPLGRQQAPQRGHDRGTILEGLRIALETVSRVPVLQPELSRTPAPVQEADRPRRRFHHHPTDRLQHGLGEAQTPEGSRQDAHGSGHVFLPA